MGNVIVPQYKLDQWREENELAESLLRIHPRNSQEGEIIRAASRDRGIKMFAMVALGFSFGLSLKRYFPGTVITEVQPLFVLATFSIILPCYSLGKIYTNREIIDKLHLINVAHNANKYK